MKFKKDKEEVMMQKMSDEVQLKLIRGKMVIIQRTKQVNGIAAELSAVKEDNGAEEPILSGIAELLEEYQGIFVVTNGLPSQGNHDSQIVLKDGAKPFKLKPYRCPYIQKTKF